MRIQHNIMAMSAYRNYTNNVSAMKKNLEKLSSGYKINRAGDDAAGLAISEKMRAQITGLETAQKNAKDGISLVQTAEGALTEVHDMLNRMVELATMSANGTYDNDTDRAQLQKEMDQLNKEINRIADSANFNGIKLFDGSMDGESTARADALKAADEAIAAAQAALDEAANATADTVFADETAPTLPNQASLNTPHTSTDETILETDYKDTGKAGFSVSLNGVTHKFKDVTDTTTTDDDDASFTLTIKDQKITFSESDLATFVEAETGTAPVNGDEVDSETLAKFLGSQIGDTWADANASGNSYNVTVVGEKLVFEATDNLDTAPTRHYEVKINGVKSGTVAAAGSQFKTAELSQTGSTGNLDATVTITYKDANGDDQTKDINFKTGTNAAGSATALIAAINGDDDLKALFTAGGDDDGITINSKDTGEGVAQVTGLTVKTATADTISTDATGATKKAGYDAFEAGTSGYVNYGTEVTIQAGPPAIDQLASTTLTFAKEDIVDGTAIRLGKGDNAQTYIFSIGEDSAYKDAENVVRVDDMVAGTDYDADTGELKTGGLDKILTKFAEVAKNNTTFTVGHSGSPGTAGKVTLKQLAEVKDSTDMSTMDNLKSYIGITSVDDEATAAAQQTAVADATAAAQKMLDDANAMKAEAEAMIEGKSLTLQIGDTAEEFNQLKVDIKDMHAASLGQEYDKDGNVVNAANLSSIRIDDQTKAADAIDVIKRAINQVSDMRGTLGATQNRLDHTINNLSVMTENIQDAESTIRDVDVAEEMMAYTKNNILIQSAQAMLAQANQVPQGVLQLLQ